MSRNEATTEQALLAGAAQLLARAAEARALDVAAILPRLRLTLDKYLLRDQPEASPQEIKGFLARLHADDLLLVIACERGDEAAWNAIVAGFQAVVRSAARGASAGEAEAEELAQSVWAELFGLRARADGQPAGKLAYYSGCGSLGGWLRAVVGQLAIDRHRRVARLVQTEEPADFDHLAREQSHGADGFRPAVAPDPEQALTEKETARALHTTLARVISELPPEDRLLVKLYYVDGLRLREAGAVLGVHEATASRRLTRLHAELRRSVETILTKEKGWTAEETARAFADMTGMETDLPQLLAAESMSGDKPKKVIGDR